MRVWLLTLVEALFVIAACTGVWWIYPPAAMILGGALGAYACERAGT